MKPPKNHRIAVVKRMYFRRYVGGLAPPSSAVVAIARSLISMYNLRSRSICYRKISNK